MGNHVNYLGQPIGFPVPDWTARPRPPRSAVEGRFCRIEPLTADRHAADLHDANLLDRDGGNWTYLPYGPFNNLAEYRAWMLQTCEGDDPLFHAIIDLASGKAVGIASYLRIEPAVGVIEVGHINYSPALQRRAAATEAMYLMMRRVFDELGYRRYEWKCDALNGPSCAAAKRLGFRFEGIFRQATIYKGRNRDTAWYSITDREWPARKAAFEAWLAPDNFTPAGDQRRSLGAFMPAD
ncbi:MAG: N-acetyltransferase [Rhodospirillaceae bacterium]|nr:MAG: N-acetyltransferase [Rhodospirillaceae bacterium]